MNPHDFQKGIGMLLYALRTRPDIAFAINTLSSRTQECTDEDFVALKRVARYLHGTKNLGLRFKVGYQEDITTATKLYAWCDASHASLSDSKSQVGTCFSIGLNGPMFYSRSISLKHNTLSSCESELGASAEATQDIIWMRKLFEQLGFPQYGPTTLYTDNASLVTLATAYSGNHKRVRHFVTRLNWMISKVEDGIVQLIHMPGSEMPADMLTKPLAKEPFEKHRKRIFNVASSTCSSTPVIISSTISTPTPVLSYIDDPTSVPLRSSLSTPLSQLLRKKLFDSTLKQKISYISMTKRKATINTITTKITTIKFKYKQLYHIQIFYKHEPPLNILKF
jgi:hypothetical protein